MKKWLWAAMLILLSGVACAATPSNLPTADFTHFTTPVSDLSMRYLGELFGTVSNILPTHGSQILGKMFYVLNTGILVVAGLWIAYVIGLIAFQGAADGNFSQPQRKSAFVFLRLAFGLALLLPNAATGYSGIQDVIMAVAVQGVKLADTTWDYALSYIHNGGFIYPEQVSNNQAQFDDAVNKVMKPSSANTGVEVSNNDGLISAAYQNEVCMDLANDYIRNHQNSTGLPVSANTQYAPVYVADAEGVDSSIYFPGFGDHSPYGVKTGLCGHLSTQTAALAKGLSSNAVQEASFDAMQQVVSDMAPAASAIAEQLANNQSVTKSDQILLKNAVFQATADYIQLMKPVDTAMTQTNSMQRAAFWQRARQEGWFEAGKYYWDLSRYNDQIASEGTLQSSVLPQVQTAFDETNPNLANATAIGREMHQAYNVLFAGDGAQGSLYLQAYQNLQNYAANGLIHGGATVGENTQASGGQLTNPHFKSGGMFLFGVIDDALGNLAHTFYSLEQKTNAGFYDPIYFMLHLGKACLAVAGNIWMSGFTISIPLALAAGICTSVSPAATLFNAMLSWVKPLYITAGLGLFVAGFMLTFYAPLYPFLLFIFGAMSWLIYVIEAMVAGPLIALGVTHPEGHDFLGKGEQALMLMLSVFLRPALMVVGFVAGLVLSYVGFSIVNYGFSQVLASVFHDYANFAYGKNLSVMNAVWGVVTGGVSGNTPQGAHFTGTSLTDLLLIPVLLIFYGIIVIEIVNQSFSLIHILPDQILRWIGGPVQQDRTEQMAQKVGQQVSGAARQIGEMGGTAAMNAGAAYGAIGGDAGGLGVMAGKQMMNGGDAAGGGAPPMA